MSQDTPSNRQQGRFQEPLDPSRWEKLRALQQATGRDFLGEVIDLFVTDTPARLNCLRQALADSDAATAERLAHSIKGSSSNIGAPILEIAAAELEIQLAEGNFAGADELLAQIELESERVGKALEALRSS